ncbi:MAG: lytic transglycosylase domain-containing protein [Bacteroidota bacterium]|nr:lytic transglycosylase domain-containing protein [Bacteroidota bacterium]
MKSKTMKMLSTLGMLTVLASLVYLFEASQTKKNILPIEREIHSITLPAKLDFCGEEVPIDDPEVMERFDRELLSNAFFESNNIIIYKRMKRHFGQIEQLLKEQGMPDDFKYLAVAESGLANVVSPAAAAGFWQFIPETGRRYGLEINDEVDERYQLDKATRAACKYLKSMKEDLGSWTLAAASYNCGMGAIKQSQKFQKVDSYYDLHINQETSRYLFRIVALKEILNAPEKYGYKMADVAGYPTIATTDETVSSTVPNWSDWAIAHGVNYKILRTFNPWIKKPLLTNKLGKTYTIQLPKDKTKFLHGK